MTPTELRTKIRDIDSLIAHLELDSALGEASRQAALETLREERAVLAEALSAAEGDARP